MEFVKENENKKLSGGLKTKKFLVVNKIGKISLNFNNEFHF